MVRFASNFFIAANLENLSFFNYQELEDYIRKLNEFGVGEFELKQVGQAVIIFFDGVPAAMVHKHCDDQIYFPILRRKYFRAPTSDWRRGVIVMGCLGSPVYIRLREQHGQLYTSFPYRRVPQGNEVAIKITFEIIHVRTDNVPFYRIVLPPLGLDTDPERYLVHISIIPKNSEKIEATLPYQVVAKYGLPEKEKGLLYL
jgi:hypothetical protein